MTTKTKGPEHTVYQCGQVSGPHFLKATWDEGEQRYVPVTDPTPVWQVSTIIVSESGDHILGREYYATEAEAEARRAALPKYVTDGMDRRIKGPLETDGQVTAADLNRPIDP